MTWIAQFDTEMLKDGYTLTESMVYGYLWWVSRKTQIHEEISPSIWLMQKTLNIGRATIIRATDKLEKKWLIYIYKGGYKERNSYFVVDMDKYPACVNYDEDKMVRGPKWNTPSPKWNTGGPKWNS